MKGLSRLMVPYGSVHGWWAPVLGQNPVVMVSLYLTAFQTERARGGGGGGGQGPAPGTYFLQLGLTS